jgi:hypothetical protein
VSGERHPALPASRHRCTQTCTLLEVFLFLFPLLAKVFKLSIIAHKPCILTLGTRSCRPDCRRGAFKDYRSSAYSAHSGRSTGPPTGDTGLRQAGSSGVPGHR